jgi:hypothetical protein
MVIETKRVSLNKRVTFKLDEKKIASQTKGDIETISHVYNYHLEEVLDEISRNTEIDREKLKNLLMFRFFPETVSVVFPLFSVTAAFIEEYVRDPLLCIDMLDIDDHTIALVSSFFEIPTESEGFEMLVRILA